MSTRSRSAPWFGPRKVWAKGPAETIAPLQLQWIPVPPSPVSIADWLNNQNASSYDLWKESGGDPVADMKHAFGALQRSIDRDLEYWWLRR